MKNLFYQLRVKQWTKNLLVFASALFAGNILNLNIFNVLAMAFLAFSFTSSIVYIMNDIMDIEKDRQHPDKCKRPIASGAISILQAVLLIIVLIILTLYLINNINLNFAYILIIYLVMNFLYSWKLKHIVIIDVMIIAFGFILRALAGVIVIGVGITNWFILCIFMLSLFLALGKRRHELELFTDHQDRQREVLQFYSKKLIDNLITIVTAMTITSYSLFAEQDKISSDKGTFPYMILTVPLVVYGMFRYMYLIHVLKLGGKPEEILLKDKHILITVLLYVTTIICIRNL